MRNLIASRSLASLRAATSRLSQGRKPFRTDRRGNIAITTALMAVPLMVFGGAALDYSRAQSLRSQLQNAADQAALAAAITDGNKSQRKTYAEKYFKGLLSNSSFASLSVTPDADVDSSGNVILVKVAASAKSPTSLLNVIGMSDIAVGVNATAKPATHGYADVYIAADNSQSMGLAATAQAITDLTNYVRAHDWMPNMPGGGCAFACHLTEYGEARPVYDVARQYGVPLRIELS